MDVRLGKGPIGHIYVRKEWLHVVRENWKLSGRRCQLGESRATSCKPVWSEWEAPGTVVTIRTVLKGVTRGSTHGLTRGGRPHNLVFLICMGGYLYIEWAYPCGWCFQWIIGFTECFIDFWILTNLHLEFPHFIGFCAWYVLG